MNNGQDNRRSKFALGRCAWATLGCLAFAIGAIGAILPVIPTTPLILFAAYCFARSSKRVEDWFKQTRLYHSILEGFINNKTMTVKAKCSVLIPVTLLMCIAGFFMRNIPALCVVLFIVWAGHILYFGIHIPTDKGDTSSMNTVENHSNQNNNVKVN